MSGKVLLLALLALVQAPLTLALVCTDVLPPSRDACEDILASNLTDTEKSLLVANLDYTSPYRPDHAYVWERNSQLALAGPPENTTVQNGMYLKNVWVRVMAVMPSVLVNNRTYVPQNLMVQSFYHHDLVPPEDYDSPGYPATSEGDCKRINSELDYGAENTVYVNGISQGWGDLVNVAISGDSQITAQYTVNVEYQTDHYRWRRYCCEYVDGECVRHCRECSFDRTDLNAETVTVEDARIVYDHASDPTAVFQVIDTFRDVMSFSFTHTDAGELSLDSGRYAFYPYLYSITPTNPPYDSYQLTATPHNVTILQSIQRDAHGFLARAPYECSISAFDFFSARTETCDFTTTAKPFHLSTDRFRYDEGDPITVTIEPEGPDIVLSYANQSQTVTGTATFQAVRGAAAITGHAGGHTETTYISVTGGYAVLFDLGLLVILLIPCHAMMKKYGGKTA